VCVDTRESSGPEVRCIWREIVIAYLNTSSKELLYKLERGVFLFILYLIFYKIRFLLKKEMNNYSIRSG
jgi:hypothetical protein